MSKKELFEQVSTSRAGDRALRRRRRPRGIRHTISRGIQRLFKCTVSR